MLFKAEAISAGSPFRSGPLRALDDVEYATMEWVDRYNNRRLHTSYDPVPGPACRLVAFDNRDATDLPSTSPQPTESELT